MNKKQKNILVVVVPIIILLVALFVASNLSFRGPFFWRETGLIWAVAVTAIAGFEYWVFRDGSLE